MDHYFDKFDPRSRERGVNWKAGLRFPPPGNVYPPRNPPIRNNDFSRLPRDNYPFPEPQRCRNFERYHYFNPVRHRMFMPPHPRFDVDHRNYKEPYRGSVVPNLNYFALDHIGVEEHNFSPPGQRNSPIFESNPHLPREESRNSPGTSHSNVFRESNSKQTPSSIAEDNPEKTAPQVNPESAKKEALAAELRKSLQKFQKTNSQSGNKLLMVDKSNESSKAESTSEPQTCFPWDLPLTVDDLKSIGRGKTGNIEASADSCSENELNMLEKQSAFHHSERASESANETSPEIQVIKQVRKRKVSESIDFTNKKKKPKSLQSRRRHRSASPTLREEEAENAGKSKDDESNLTTSEKESNHSLATSPRIGASRRPRQKPSLMELLGVRRREFSEMVDQPRNPKVQFMLNLLMKRHKELLSQRSLRSRFSAINGKLKVRGSQKEKESDQAQAETLNSDETTLGSMGASDAIDELTHILLDSSLTVDLSSLPQELIEQLGNFLEMGVDLSSLSDEIMIGDELVHDSANEIVISDGLVHNSVNEIEEIQQRANDSCSTVNLLGLTPVKDTASKVNAESSEIHHAEDIRNLNRKESISSNKVQKSSTERASPHTKGRAKLTEKTLPKVNSEPSAIHHSKDIKNVYQIDCMIRSSSKKLQKSISKPASPHAKRRTKLTEETVSRKEKTVPSNSCSVVPCEKNHAKESDQQLGERKASCHSKGLVAAEGESSGILRLNIESVTIPSESEPRNIIPEESSVINSSAPEKCSEKEVTGPSLMSAPAENSVFQISPVSSSRLVAPADPLKDEEETEEKLLSKMWDIDMEIGKLMAKKQELYHKLTQLRHIRQNPQSIVFVSKDTQESVPKPGTRQSESVNKELNKVEIVDRVSGVSSKEHIVVPQPSFSENHSSPSHIDNSEIPPTTCDSAKHGEAVTLVVHLTESERTVNFSEKGDNSQNKDQSKEMQTMNSEAGHSSHQKKDTPKKDGNNCEPRIISSGAVYLTGHKETVLAIKVHKQFLYAACADFTVYCFNLQQMRIVMQYIGHTNTVTSLHISVDHRGVSRLFSGSHDQTLKMYSARTGALIKSYHVEEKITCMEECWGILFIGTKEGNILRLNILKSTFIEPKLPGVKTEVMAIQTSKEGPRKVLIVALRDKPIVVRDASTGLLLRSINKSTEKHIVYAIHADHGLVYAGSSLYGLTAWDFTNGLRVHQYEGCGSIVAVHVVNRKIYAASYDGNIYLYDCANSKPEHIIRASNKMLLCLAVKHNKIYVGSLDKKLQIWKSPYKM